MTIIITKATTLEQLLLSWLRLLLVCRCYYYLLHLLPVLLLLLVLLHKFQSPVSKSTATASVDLRLTRKCSSSSATDPGIIPNNRKADFIMDFDLEALRFGVKLSCLQTSDPVLV